MPLVETIGIASAKGFGVGSYKKEAPGSITYANGYSGASYVPQGYSTVTVTLYGSCGSVNYAGVSSGIGYGSKVVKAGVPAGTLFIRCPNGRRVSQWTTGSGGIGAVVTNTPYNGGQGGAVCAAVWTGGVLVAAGGGGSASNNAGSRSGKIEGFAWTAGGNAGSGGNGGDGNSPGACYYGGGGGGGGYSVGGTGGAVRNGGAAGGNGAAPSPTGTGSYGYDSVTVGDNTGLGYAVVSWG